MGVLYSRVFPDEEHEEESEVRIKKTGQEDESRGRNSQHTHSKYIECSVEPFPVHPCHFDKDRKVA